MKNRYITTTLPYVNASPHVGFALELVQTDALARFFRLRGDEVFFSTGVDEHGQKIYEKAKEEGRDTQEYVDYFARQFKELHTALNLSNDGFVRTTDKKHTEAAQALWGLCEKKGDIYKKKYKGLYCVGDEAFLKEGDLVEGKCPHHPTMDPIEIEEENYFFKLSNYQKQIEELLSEPNRTLPDWRRKEIAKFVSGGLEDISISRDLKRMPWGIPVPGDDTQVMYVWFDALINYISVLGWPKNIDLFEKFWIDGNTIQMAGKDQTRFQSVIWQAMLMSADLPATDQIFYHGFINSGGQKMSKSIGNVINPYDMVDKYGTDAVRYILLRHVHPTEDTDVTWERMDEWYNSGLVNGLGNITARIMRLAELYLEEPVQKPVESPFVEEYTAMLENFDFNGVLNFIWNKIQALDKIITDEEVFKVVKVDTKAGCTQIQKYVEELYLIGKLLNPILPETSVVLKKTILENKKPENLFPRLT